MDEELQALQQVIQDLHQLISIVKDPNDTAVISQCLSALTKVQRDMMLTRPQQSAQQAVVQRLQGGQGQPQPGY